MKCALCLINEADKKNTHYLTDAIIRSCLNQEGANKREKGFYFDLSNNSAFVEFNFQRETSVDKLEEALGRPPSDDEINNAKKIPFSVDNVFCSECETIFTNIEEAFIRKYLHLFRNSDLSKETIIKLDDVKLIRLFFILQVWRLNVCESVIKLPETTAESLRILIKDYLTIGVCEYKRYPISITYLETLGGEKEYTTNFVGFTNDQNPYLLFMNDFAIQFYDSNHNIKLNKFHGLNNELNYRTLINYCEDEFLVNIMHNSQRKQFLYEFVREERVNQVLKLYESAFEKLWLKVFGGYPPKQITQEYLKEITKGGFDVLKYTKERIVELTRNFIIKKLK